MKLFTIRTLLTTLTACLFTVHTALANTVNGHVTIGIGDHSNSTLSTSLYHTDPITDEEITAFLTSMSEGAQTIVHQPASTIAYVQNPNNRTTDVYNGFANIDWFFNQALKGRRAFTHEDGSYQLRSLQLCCACPNQR